MKIAFKNISFDVQPTEGGAIVGVNYSVIMGKDIRQDSITMHLPKHPLALDALESLISMAVAASANFTVNDPKKDGLICSAIIQEVSEYYNIQIKDLSNASRKMQTTKPRHVAMYLIKNNTKMSYTAIGLLFKRDHSSVIHACTLIEAEIKHYPDLAHDVREITKKIRNAQSI